MKPTIESVLAKLVKYEIIEKPARPSGVRSQVIKKLGRFGLRELLKYRGFGEESLKVLCEYIYIDPSPIAISVRSYNILADTGRYQWSGFSENLLRNKPEFQKWIVKLGGYAGLRKLRNCGRLSAVEICKYAEVDYPVDEEKLNSEYRWIRNLLHDHPSLRQGVAKYLRDEISALKGEGT